MKKRNNKKDPVVDVIRKRMKEIILLTSYEDDDHVVWGMDTECGKMDDLIDSALHIIQNGIKNEDK